MKKPRRITSAKQANEESMALKSVWSQESFLTQRILIYIASLLEKRTAQRKPTTWQKYLGKALKAGKTIQQAGAEWRARK